MPALRWLWYDAAPVNDVNNQIRTLLDCSCFIDEVLDAHPTADVIPACDALKLEHATFAMNNIMNALLDHFARTAGHVLFNVTPKNHYMCHIAMRCGCFNPRRSWCYAGEDFMRHIARMAAGCARGSTPQQCGAKMMTWYAHALGMMLTI